jgi:hypothetical protein
MACAGARNRRAGNQSLKKYISKSPKSVAAGLVASIEELLEDLEE